MQNNWYQQMNEKQKKEGRYGIVYEFKTFVQCYTVDKNMRHGIKVFDGGTCRYARNVRGLCKRPVVAFGTIKAHSFSLDAHRDCAPTICVSGRTHSEKGRKGEDDCNCVRICHGLIIWQKLCKISARSFLYKRHISRCDFFFSLSSPFLHIFLTVYASIVCFFRIVLDKTILFFVATLYKRALLELFM